MVPIAVALSAISVSFEVMLFVLASMLSVVFSLQVVPIPMFELLPMFVLVSTY